MIDTSNEPSRFDQTQFSLEEPMYEGLVPLPQEKKIEEVKEKIPLLKQRKFLTGLIVGTILLVLVILLIVNAVIANSRRPIAPEVTPLPSGATTFSHPIEAKIQFLKEELETFEDDQSTLVNPAVDYKITLDEVKN